MALLYFLAGIIFVTYVIPLFDGLQSLILTWLKLQETKCSAKIYQIKEKATSSQDSKKVIGFTYEEEDDE